MPRSVRAASKNWLHSVTRSCWVSWSSAPGPRRTQRRMPPPLSSCEGSDPPQRQLGRATPTEMTEVNTMNVMPAEIRPEEASGTAPRKRVVIVGGGFAGVNAARALRHADADVLLIDRRNHHIFHPLLYQVATAVLSPAEIA